MEPTLEINNNKNSDIAKINDDEIGKKVSNIYNKTVLSPIENTDSRELAKNNEKQIEIETPHDFVINLVEKYLPGDYANDVRRDELRLINLEENSSIRALKQKGELSLIDEESIHSLVSEYGIAPDNLTVEEANDLLLFASNGDSVTISSKMPREEKNSILQKKAEIKERKLGYIYDDLAFATNGIRQDRRELVPDRIREKQARDYDISPSGYDISNALEDKAIDMPYIEEYGDTIYSYDEDYDDYGFSINYGDKNRFYGHQLKEKLEEMDKEEIGYYIPEDYKYRYGGFTNLDLEDISDISNKVWDTSVNGRTDSDVALFISEIVPQSTRKTTTEKTSSGDI